MQARRTITAALCALILTAGPGAFAAEERHPARHSAVRELRHKVVSPEAAARSVASAGINTARNYPHEWGTGAGGFAKRAGSAFGQHAVAATIEVGVGKMLHEDLHYRRSNLQGTWPRMKYAVKSTFIVPRTDRPGKTVAVGRVAGNMGGGLISRAWMPASAASVGAGLASGGIGLGADVGVHVAREFWPQKKRRAPMRPPGR